MSSGMFKKDNIKITGKRILGTPGVGVSPGGRGASARIVRQDANITLVEVACECGKTIHVRCFSETPAEPTVPMSSESGDLNPSKGKELES